MEIEKSKVSIQFPLFSRQSGDVLFFLFARRLRGYTATIAIDQNFAEKCQKNFFTFFEAVLFFNPLSHF